MNRIQIVIWGIIFHVYEQGYKEDVNYVPICPENLEVHKKRAIEVCPHEPQKYHCLPVRNFSTFIEDCKQPYYYRHGTCLVWDRPGVIDTRDIENGPENSYLSNTFNVGCKVPSDSTTIFSSSPSTTPSSTSTTPSSTSITPTGSSTSTTPTGSSTSTTPSSTTFSTSPLMKKSLPAAQIAGIVIGSLIGLGLVAAVVFCIKRCRRYKKYEKANSEKTLKMGSQSSGRKLEKKNGKLEHGYDNKKTIKCETGDEDTGTSGMIIKQLVHKDNKAGNTVSGSQGDLDIIPRAIKIDHPQPVPIENEDLDMHIDTTNEQIADDIHFKQQGPTTSPLSEKVFAQSSC